MDNISQMMEIEYLSHHKCWHQNVIDSYNWFYLKITILKYYEGFICEHP